MRCPEAKTSVSGGREPSTASCCWEIRSDDHRETTSGFGNSLAIGDVDHENSVTFNSLFQKQGKVRVVGAAFVLV